jgi:catechol 2,3-dioxygenase-like lactoylglutathione lyase family enzyme
MFEKLLRLRCFAAALALLAAPLSAAAPAAEERAAGERGVAPPPAIAEVESIGITVSELARSLAFYTGLLGFEKVSEAEISGPDYERLQGVFAMRARVVRLRLGEETVELTQYLAPRGRSIPEDSRSNDRWFQHIAIVVSDIDKAFERLSAGGVEQVSPFPQRLPDWNPAAGGIRAFYFKDPDRHVLEVIEYPAGKGAARWQKSGGRLFLGIDHTAIVVGDTETSLGFYRGVLGLEVAGESLNHGPEQEYLNGVFGARLRITALKAERGPGIELLEYLAPSDGRPSPVDLRANDLAHWQTRVVARDLDRAAAALGAAGAALVSPGAVPTSDRRLGFHRASLVRDPDGHGMQVVER